MCFAAEQQMRIDKAYAAARELTLVQVIQENGLLGNLRLGKAGQFAHGVAPGPQVPRCELRRYEGMLNYFEV